MNGWNKKNALWMILYMIMYAATTAIVCVTGAIHPVLFVCYQITAGLLLPGIVIHAFRRIKAPGVPVCFAAGMILLFLVIQDAAAWHVIPIIVTAVLAEIIRAITKYSWTGDVISTVIMSFSTFGYYGQIWFNRNYTYECAVEEMPAGYADALMVASPVWTFVVVIIIGVMLSVLISNVITKLFALDRFS
ncbi:MAG: MptD family putative ECF transporter S component [Eubacteriales bacterium]|nr:MptD family putative ECF transporter S component [Eubacteriales bacterium]